MSEPDHYPPHYPPSQRTTDGKPYRGVALSPDEIARSFYKWDPKSPWNHRPPATAPVPAKA